MNYAATSQPVSNSDSCFRADVGKWFGAWELVSKNVYGLKKFDEVDFVFFDQHFVYTTSLYSANNGHPIEGPALMGKNLRWFKQAYTDSISFPNGNKVETGLMSFASGRKGGSPFFVMPLLSFWESAGVSSKELGLANLVTAVFLHEFSHSQQMKNFGRKIAALEKSHQYPVEFNDDIVQQVFGNDSNYAAAYHAETLSLYDASAFNNLPALKIKTRESLILMAQRHEKYFKDSLSHYKSIDPFFLTMEGIGQYSMYVWLSHPQGAALPREQVITGIRRGKKQWSQDEGFALFLILEKLAPVTSWSAQMFGKQLHVVTDLIKNQIN